MIAVQYIVRKSWYGAIKIVLQVKEAYYDSTWRDATLNDLNNIEIENERARMQVRECAGYFFPKGSRVVVNDVSKFSRGSHGVVEFQEPLSGKVWVSRDGADAPSYFFANELHFEEGVFTAPLRHTLNFYFTKEGKCLDYWWIAVGPGKISAENAIRWCRENDVAHPTCRSISDHIQLIGFEDQGNAMLFYLRFL